MWKINDTVLYRASGLCRIENITEEKFGDEVQEYYVLRPLGDEKSIVHIPCSNTILCSKMHSLMTRDEIEDLIESLPTLSSDWPESDKRRAEYFRSVLETGNRRDIAGIIMSIRRRREELIAIGKKPRAVDESICARAEKLLLDEFNFVLERNIDVSVFER
ncbi:MAG: CarD family transcriptional regulator [Clostridia bacterium]|nr:CarD family transcriptional regulator [Clostridia bacterium]